MNRRIMALAFPVVALSMRAYGAVNIQMNADGSLYTGVVVNGPSSIKYDIVIIGDGFTATDQGLFNTKVGDVVTVLQGKAPYSDHMCALNIWRVNVVSAESGADHPKDGILKNTELDCRYGDPGVGEAERCITSDSPAKCFEAASYAPDQDAVFVLVNDTQSGGCSGGLVFTAIAPGFAGILTHELGHKIGDLADEYDCYVCNGSDDDRVYTGAEPTEPNATIETDRVLVKWSSFIDPNTPLPTTVNMPVGVVGLWEGAAYYAKGVYRPQWICHMRSTAAAFCAVCDDAMARSLGSHCSLCELAHLTPTLAFVCLDLGRFRPVPHWTAPFVIRFPFPPPCLSCPPDLMVDDIDFRLTDLPGEGFELRIVDDKGEVITEAVAEDGTLEVSFSIERSQQFFAEIITSGPTQDELTFGAEFRRNGVVEQLP